MSLADIMINERNQSIRVKVYSPRFYIYEIQGEVTLILEGGNQNSGYHLGREVLTKKGRTNFFECWKLRA